MSLSTRAEKVAAASGDLDHLWAIIQNIWEPDANPTGTVSLGLAENSLMHDEFSKHLHKSLNISNHYAFTYGDGPTGTRRVKAAMARLLTKHLKAAKPIEPAHVAVTNGCSSAIEHCQWALANPGEGFLLGRPYYGTFVPDLTLRFGAKLLTVAFDDVDPVGEDCVRKYEDVILEAQKNGQGVAGLVISNPHNPLGRCYSRNVMTALMRLCEKYQLHFVSDEIYGLSVFENAIDKSPAPVPFCSALAIDPAGIIDPGRVHVLWGMSKDFGANGLRMGAIISQSNPAFISTMGSVGLYSSTSSLSDHVTANLLEDEPWVENYIKENQTKLGQQYEKIVAWAQKNDIEYAPGVNAAFFLWVNLGKAYLKHKPSAAAEDLDKVVTEALTAKKVFLASGVGFGSEQPGWFRIVFSHKDRYLFEGLDRIVAALET